MYKDLREVREHYAALRDLIAQNPGGREDMATRAKVSVLCEAAIAELQDPECRQRPRRDARPRLAAAGRRRRADIRRLAQPPGAM